MAVAKFDNEPAAWTIGSKRLAPIRPSLARTRSAINACTPTVLVGLIRFPGETSCLSLWWAVLDVFIAGARGLGLSDLEYREVVQFNNVRAYPDQTATKVA